MTYYSQILKQEFEVRKSQIGRVWVKFQDGVIYAPNEINLLKGVDDEIKPILHNVKDVFDGEVVEVGIELKFNDKYKKK
jgi:hypothetical protein